MHVLVIESKDLAALLIEEILETGGVHVAVAGRDLSGIGATAIEAAKNSEWGQHGN